MKQITNSKGTFIVKDWLDIPDDTAVKFIGTASDILKSEELAKQIVEGVWFNIGSDNCEYKNYKFKDKTYSFHKATKSFDSFMQHHSISPTDLLMIKIEEKWQK